MTCICTTRASTGIGAHPDEALEVLCERVQVVSAETVPWPLAAGRVLAEAVRLDRPSPACDVSAMDGYAVRLSDLALGKLSVHDEVRPGRCAQGMRPGSAIRIFTGAMVPPGAEAIIPREQVSESQHSIHVSEPLEVREGQHIRRCGENGRPGRIIGEAGRIVTAPMLAAIASCGVTTVEVYRALRIGIIITGDEVRPTAEALPPWQLRDGNGPALVGLLRGAAWLDPAPPVHVDDQPGAIAAVVAELLPTCDALLLTGGVSAGDHDHVPHVLHELGLRTVFHKLPIRPGKPLLGAVDDVGRPAFGLPGNPISAMITARRFALEALRKRAGFAEQRPSVAHVEVRGSTPAPAALNWYPLVRINTSGRADLLRGMGSGDWVSAAHSDGFIEVPPREQAAGFRPFYSWSAL